MINKIQVKYEKMHADVQLPQQQTPNSAGYDIYSYLETPIKIAPMQRVAIPTGLKVEIPPGYLISVRPRSGLSIKEGLTLINPPGTIDADFRGEIKILMINLSSETRIIGHQQRIAQLLLEQYYKIDFINANIIPLTSSNRGGGGFGSTGKN